MEPEQVPDQPKSMEDNRPEGAQTDTDGLNKIADLKEAIESHAKTSWQEFLPEWYKSSGDGHYLAKIKIGKEEWLDVEVKGDKDNAEVLNYKAGTHVSDDIKF